MIVLLVIMPIMLMRRVRLACVFGVIPRVLVVVTLGGGVAGGRAVDRHAIVCLIRSFHLVLPS